MKYVILLNRKFPYKSGEAFLENEIDEISEYVDQIYIYPSDIKIGEKQTRNIKSNNVETRIIESEDFSKRKKSYLLKSLKYFFEAKSSHHIRNKIIESYFLAASYSQADKIIEDLKKIEISKNDEIILYSYWLYINAKVGCILKKYLQSQGYKVILVSRAHAFDIYEEKRRYHFLPQRREILENVDMVFPCSDNGTKYLKKKYSKYSHKISTSYLGTYDHGIKEYVRHKQFNILSCSRLSDVKRVDLILEALKILDNNDINITWTHIGSGDNYDILKDRCKKELKNIKVNLMGAIKNSEVYDYYLNNDVDLFVNVSYSEGLPVSIMEAISFGTPVIATNVGGTSEIVDNDNGYLIDCNFEINELAVLIEKVRNLKEKDYLALRNNSRNKWERKFEAKKNYKDFIGQVLEIERK